MKATVVIALLLAVGFVGCSGKTALRDLSDQEQQKLADEAYKRICDLVRADLKYPKDAKFSKKYECLIGTPYDANNISFMIESHVRVRRYKSLEYYDKKRIDAAIIYDGDTEKWSVSFLWCGDKELIDNTNRP